MEHRTPQQREQALIALAQDHKADHDHWRRIALKQQGLVDHCHKILQDLRPKMKGALADQVDVLCTRIKEVFPDGHPQPVDPGTVQGGQHNPNPSGR